MSPGSVALAVIDDMPLFELAIACEVFGPKRTDLADPWYDLRLCAADPSGTRGEFGFWQRADHGLEHLADAETVIVPALPYACVQSGRPIPPELIAAVRAAADAGARIVSLCTGSFVLAAAGLLDGRRAATHWMYAATLAMLHPLVQVDDTVLYVDDGDVLTSAGRSAGIDLCLHVVRRDLGAHVANQVARRMVLPAHRAGGQSQYVAVSVPDTDDDGLGPLLHWATENLDQPLTVDVLARRAGMSARTFVRRFHDATATTPLQWLLTQRVIRARSLLESTDLAVDQVGERSGLGSAANLRRHFALHLGVTPTAYRRAFRATT
ncbi:transcriptional regulator GlxA family with amidase domain [Saccharothrix ecbatanensis]|uniref:Transcriptional regulator GlxA family with amidase domain n=1 Tax=Saccharothrix ecbatanensis TaxID=1105145 RepID=A0A7W9LYJ6_9PSEU|nr:helix-turn-helix domain-containing protein [Saccharothrix ecbatanensis]MBB5800950.1 transcriptional regulator GlxA family with amidase domain [Saccharothrix ecbatanensis]